MVPMCWKCCHKVTEENPTDGAGFTSFKLVGCTESTKVVDYNTACMYCPIIFPKGKNKHPRKPR